MSTAAVEAAAQRNGAKATGAELLAARYGHIDVKTLANLITVEPDDAWALDTASIGGESLAPDHIDTVIDLVASPPCSPTISL